MVSNKSRRQPQQGRTPRRRAGSFVTSIVGSRRIAGSHEPWSCIRDRNGFHEERVHAPRNKQTNEPAIVIKRPHRRNQQSSPRHCATNQRSNDRSPVPTARVSVRASNAIKTTQLETPPSDQPVIRYQHSGNRSQSARIPAEPFEDI